MSKRNIVEPVCFYCRHLTVWPKCKAFPDGIPKNIRDGALHDKPQQGDHGMQFSPAMKPPEQDEKE